MSKAGKSRFAVVFLMLFGLGMSLGLAAEDVLEVVYDECEVLPFETIPQLSVALRPTVAQASPAPLSPFLLHPDVPSSSPPVSRRDETVPRRSPDARASLALLCTLLC